jgi:uncharacterized Zn finger protein (UPF0148 family)
MADERASAENANRLYWESDRSVNKIADELGLSKGALYALVEPLVTDAGCPHCGVALVFSNRTARQRGLLDCPGCEAEVLESEVVALAVARESAEREEESPDEGEDDAPWWETGEARRREAESVADEARAEEERRDAGARNEERPAAGLFDFSRLRERANGPGSGILAGGALLGVAAGILLVSWMRRR